MAEPTTTSGAVSAALTAAPVALTAALPFINTNAMVGAFGGGILFVFHAKKFGLLKRLSYMLVSMSMGYIGSDELVDRGITTSHGISAFIISALIVTAGLWAIDGLRDGTIANIFSRK